MTDEHEDPRDARRLLASAYLDGELTPAERAEVETDPLVLAEVEALRSVRAQLAAVPAADATRREAAIAAAMAATGSEVRTPPRPSIESRRRARWFAPLAAAAAAAVLVVGGIVALRTTGDDDQTTGEREAVLSEPMTDDDTGGADVEDEASATTTAAAASAGAETTAGGATTQAAGEAATEGTQAAEETTGAADAAQQPGDVVVRDAADLRAVVTLFTAAESTEAAATGTALPDRVVPRCDLGTFITLGRYEPPTGPASDVEIYVLQDTGELVAADVATCVELLRATP
jgi:hypothetical protein